GPLAPVMLFMTIASVTMCARLDRAQEAFVNLSEAVERMRRFLDANDYGWFEGAAELIDGIRLEFEHCQVFTDDMLKRLSLVQWKVSQLRSKYGRLVTGDIASENDAASAVSDLNRFYLATLHDIQVDVLRLYRALQEDNPRRVEFLRSKLRDKIERYGKDFRRVIDDDRVGDFHRKLKADRNSSLRSKMLHRVRVILHRVPVIGRQPDAIRRVRTIRKDFDSVRARIKPCADALASALDDPQSIVVCRELGGERAWRAFCTRDLQLQEART
ncbi:MAG: hypothetical protein OXG44_08070, partial [Gammaproteobacteria bacterium]|nr:hypothetical protein [Gammaproteobacteria bacterium]